MVRSLPIPAFILVGLMAVSGASPTAADHTTACTVASVVDGDTFDCTDGTRVPPTLTSDVRLHDPRRW
jgi:hypothetical protein